MVYGGDSQAEKGQLEYAQYFPGHHDWFIETGHPGLKDVKITLYFSENDSRGKAAKGKERIDLLTGPHRYMVGLMFQQRIPNTEHHLPFKTFAYGFGGRRARGIVQSESYDSPESSKLGTRKMEAAEMEQMRLFVKTVLPTLKFSKFHREHARWEALKRKLIAQLGL